MTHAAQADTIKIRGTVERIFHSLPNFSAGAFRTSEGDIVQFVGNLNAEEHAPLVLTGFWSNHPKYGRQFKVTGMTYDKDLDAEGLAKYLAHSPAVKGIGEVKARLIAARFAHNFRHFLEHEAAEIAKTAKVPVSVIEALREHWFENEEMNHLKAELAAYDLTKHQIEKVVEKLGVNALGILRDNPYCMIRHIDGLGFARVDRIAQKMGVAKDDHRRIEAGILHCVDEALENGDCWIEYEDLLDAANRALAMDNLDSKDMIESALDGLLDQEKLVCVPTDSSRFLVAKPEIRRMEEDISKALLCATRLNPCFPDYDRDDIREEACELTPGINDEQLDAVANACRHTISLVVGGAGVGKTFTIRAIARMFAARGLDVALAAPTGKAAKRMHESCGREAYTIHRLLGYNGKRFRKGPDDLITEHALVIDESSMIDTPLAWHLFRAVDFGRTCVVLVGDHNQLPPVGPGNPLRDLINTRIVPTTILANVQRHAGPLKENSCAILRGEVRSDSPKDERGRRAWYLVDHLTEPLRVQMVIQRLYEEVLFDKLGFHLLRDVQLLTPTRKGTLGTRELNILLQRVIQKKFWNLDVLPVEPNRRPSFYVNDKVIQTRNDYDLGVMNGTIGIVRETRRDGSLVVEFDGSRVMTHASNHLELAYALTFHRAQGSEFDCSILVVHKAHSFMHHRNLFYTGVTRARKSAIILGDRWGITNCAKRVQVDNRKTFLPFLLASTKAEPVELDNVLVEAEI